MKLLLALFPQKNKNIPQNICIYQKIRLSLHKLLRTEKFVLSLCDIDKIYTASGTITHWKSSSDEY